MGIKESIRTLKREVRKRAEENEPLMITIVYDEWERVVTRDENDLPVRSTNKWRHRETGEVIYSEEDPNPPPDPDHIVVRWPDDPEWED